MQFSSLLWSPRVSLISWFLIDRPNNISFRPYSIHHAVVPFRSPFPHFLKFTVGNAGLYVNKHRQFMQRDSNLLVTTIFLRTPMLRCRPNSWCYLRTTSRQVATSTSRLSQFFPSASAQWRNPKADMRDICNAMFKHTVLGFHMTCHYVAVHFLFFSPPLNSILCVYRTHFSKRIWFYWFQTFAVFWILYVFFWVFPRRPIVVCRHFGTLYQFHLQGLDVIQPLKMELIRRQTTIGRRGNTQKNTYKNLIFFCIC